MEPETPPPGNAEPISEAEALRRLRQNEDQSLQYYGAWWLGRMRSRHPDTVPLLCQALRQRQPRDAGAGVEHNAVARNAARALGKLADQRAIGDGRIGPTTRRRVDTYWAWRKDPAYSLPIDYAAA